MMLKKTRHFDTWFCLPNTSLLLLLGTQWGQSNVSRPNTTSLLSDLTDLGSIAISVRCIHVSCSQDNVVRPRSLFKTRYAASTCRNWEGMTMHASGLLSPFSVMDTMILAVSTLNMLRVNQAERAAGSTLVRHVTVHEALYSGPTPSIPSRRWRQRGIEHTCWLWWPH